MTTIPTPIVEILVSGIILFIAGAIYWIFTKKLSKNPTIHDLELALKPYVLQAIFAGEKIARKGLEDSRVVLAGADRKAIASYFYSQLPEFIEIFGFKFDVKANVSQAYFDTLVEQAFKETDTLLLQSETDLDNLVKSLPASQLGQG